MNRAVARQVVPDVTRTQKLEIPLNGPSAHHEWKHGLCGSRRTASPRLGCCRPRSWRGVAAGCCALWHGRARCPRTAAWSRRIGLSVSQTRIFSEPPSGMASRALTPHFQRSHMCDDLSGDHPAVARTMVRYRRQAASGDVREFMMRFARIQSLERII